MARPFPKERFVLSMMWVAAESSAEEVFWRFRGGVVPNRGPVPFVFLDLFCLAEVHLLDLGKWWNPPDLRSGKMGFRGWFPNSSKGTKPLSRTFYKCP